MQKCLNAIAQSKKANIFTSNYNWLWQFVCKSSRKYRRNFAKEQSKLSIFKALLSSRLISFWRVSYRFSQSDKVKEAKLFSLLCLDEEIGYGGFCRFLSASFINNPTFKNIWRPLVLWASAFFFLRPFNNDVSFLHKKREKSWRKIGTYSEL